MAASAQSTLESIERRRAQLQDSVEKLRKALTHWTTWQAEYQLLSEEIQSAGDASPDQIRNLAKGLDSTLLDAKEIEELLGRATPQKRTANQVVDVISRRIDYVQQNSATIEKQLDAAEKQLAGVDVLLDPGVENEEGLPMMDIEEELDDEGNEIASSVNQTGKNAAEVVEILRKAGLQKAELDKKKASAPTQPEATVTDASAAKASSPAPAKADAAEPTQNLASPDVDTAPEVPSSRITLEKDGYNAALADMNFTRGTKVIELDEDDNELASYPVIPQGESAEDAELRRQMLQYGLSEVGQIVAELNLDTPKVEYTDDEDEDEDDWGDETEDEEEEEDEDEWGRTTKPVVDDEYRKQMLALEKKLNARMMENVGPEGSNESLRDHVQDIRTMKIRPDEQFDESIGTPPTKPDSTQKKAVRFANALDVSEAPLPTPKTETRTKHKNKAPATVSDTIVERPAAGSAAVDAPSKPAKMSRFKSSRAGAGATWRLPTLPTPPVPEAPVVPTGPAGRTLATRIVEHDVSTAQPCAPDEFDAVAINGEIQVEYHKARNKFIQQQTGFRVTDEDDESPLAEHRDGKTKRVSRFMAARLKADGM
ncbi:hypothetical protein ACEQ8H_007605 [Pleosporales sp. CAS-2024a]